MSTETPHRDPIYAECERLRGENERLVEALAFSRPAPPARYKQTPDERIFTVTAGWVGFVLGAFIGVANLGPHGLAISLPGAAFAVVAVLFTQWALRISP